MASQLYEKKITIESVDEISGVKNKKNKLIKRIFIIL
jgi:hypothetical protein